MGQPAQLGRVMSQPGHVTHGGPSPSSQGVNIPAALSAGQVLPQIGGQASAQGPNQQMQPQPSVSQTPTPLGGPINPPSQPVGGVAIQMGRPAGVPTQGVNPQMQGD
jgi:hypothetical protein